MVKRLLRLGRVGRGEEGTEEGVPINIADDANLNSSVPCFPNDRFVLFGTMMGAPSLLLLLSLVVLLVSLSLS